MKKLMLAMAMAVLCSVWPARAGDAVEPNSVTFTNLRAQAVETLNVGVIYRGSTLLLTNCQAWATSTTNGSVQGLSGVTVQVSVGDLATNVDYTATVTSTNGGRWSCPIVVPNMATFLLQVKLTDENTNTYIYPNKVMSADLSLF